MDSGPVIAGALSAALHAVGNAAVKASTRPPLSMTAQTLASAGHTACDAQGMRRVDSTLAYGGVLSISNALLWASCCCYGRARCCGPWRQRCRTGRCCGCGARTDRAGHGAAQCSVGVPRQGRSRRGLQLDPRCRHGFACPLRA